MKLKTLVIAALFAAASAACATDPGTSPAVERTLVTHADVQIETLSQGKGQVIVILPSLGRGAEDYDLVASRLEADGFRVLRPQPRGIGQSEGPMHKPMLGDRVTVKVIPDCGHAMAPEQPGAMSAAIAGFARRIYSSNQQGSTR